MRVYKESDNLMHEAIQNESVKDVNGIVVKRVADIVEIALAKLFEIPIIPTIDKQLIEDYGFATKQQLDLYYQCLAKVPKGLLSNEIKKSLRAAILQNRLESYIAGLQGDEIVPKPTGVPEEF